MSLESGILVVIVVAFAWSIAIAFMLANLAGVWFAL